MKIAILSGSARTNNNTLRVAKALSNELSTLHDVSIVDFVNYDIPLMVQGSLNKEALSEFQKLLVQTIDEAQVIITLSPEYNWSITPELLNMYHALGVKDFAHLFHNKVFAFVGVSAGRGGKAPCLQMMQICNKVVSFTGGMSVVSAKIFESHETKNVLDEHGNSTGNAIYDKGLQDFTNYTMAVADKWFN
ncbi:MAG: NAD(P)H-dependent oxidoreductase [Bacteroidetes bacterium]|nr:NAD(P)H-dependent oxidoreductase [Bacteroidota bacterium]